MPQSLPLQVLESLQRVTDAALAYLNEDELLEELLQRVAEILEVDTVAILLLEGDRLHARAAKGIEEEVEQGVQIPLGRGFAGRVAAEKRAITISDVDHADIFNPILREKGIKSLLGVPLLVQGRVIGVLHVGSLTPREFSDDDRDLLQLAADRAALAIAQAQLYTRERDARQAAELITRQLRAVQKVTDATLAYLPEEELLQELLQRVSDILAVDTVAILLLEGDRLHARAAKGIEEEVEQGVPIPLGRGFAGRIAAEKRAIAIADVDHADILNPILREKGIKSLLGVPLLVQGRVIGVLHVGSLTPREFTEDDRDLLQLAADRAALGIEQARALRAAAGRRGGPAAAAAPGDLRPLRARRRGALPPRRRRQPRRRLVRRVPARRRPGGRRGRRRRGARDRGRRRDGPAAHGRARLRGRGAHAGRGGRPRQQPDAQPRAAGDDDDGLPRDRPGDGVARARQRRAPARAASSIPPARPTSCGRAAASRSAPPRPRPTRPSASRSPPARPS